MNCMEAQALITPFINDKLNIATLEAFIDHVEGCKECKEELEVYYAILSAMRQLDEDEEVIADFSKELEHKLKDSQDKILRAKLVHIRKRILFFVIAIGIGLLTSVSMTVVEETLTLSKEAEFNQFVFCCHVFVPYMDDSDLIPKKSYSEIQQEADLWMIEQKDKERLEQDSQRNQLERKRAEELEKSIEDTKDALGSRYREDGRYSKRYELSSEYQKARYDQSSQEEDGQGSNIDSLQQYSQ